MTIRSPEDRVTGVRSIIGEGVHTLLRKWTDSPAGTKAWQGIKDLPDGEWSKIVGEVAETVLTYLAEEEHIKAALETNYWMPCPDWQNCPYGLTRYSGPHDHHVTDGRVGVMIRREQQ